MSSASRLATEARMVADDEFKAKLGLLICTDNSKLEELLKSNFTITRILSTQVGGQVRN